MIPMVCDEADTPICPRLEDAECIFKDVTKFMDEACICLSAVGINVSGLLQDLNKQPECLATLQSDLKRFENETRTLSHNLQSVLSVCAKQVSQQSSPCETMADRSAEVEEMRSKVMSLQRENDKLSAQLTVTQGDNVRLRSQLTHQSAFCASLGSVLGNLVWKASRVPPVVDLLLSGNKAADFLCIVSGTLESFLETFNTEMPGPSADESQFIMAMGGIVTNMAAAPAGRQFLVTDPNGRELIQQIIRVLPVIPTPSGNCLKRLLLMALYNVSINQEGLSLLLEDRNGAIFSVTRDCLKQESTSELRRMSMRLLLSLTCEINDPAMISQIPHELVAQIAVSDDPELQSMAQEVNENLIKAQERFKQASYKSTGAYQPPGQIAKSHCEAEDSTERRQIPATWRLPTHP